VTSGGDLHAANMHAANVHPAADAHAAENVHALGLHAAADLKEMAAAAGLRRIHMLAWRDLDDPEAGGSELHAARVAERWAAAGIEVSMRTSFAAGHPGEIDRDGYHVTRKAGRYLMFPRAVLSSLAGRSGEWDGLVEIWNGMPFFSPVWSNRPKTVWLHHVHGEMWRMVLPPGWARLGEVTERRIAPLAYRRTAVITLSESSRHDIVDTLGLRPSRVSVVPPGVDARFTPGGTRSPVPLVAAVGRLVPVKRLDLLVDALVRLRRQIPDLTAVLAGEGYELPKLRAQVAQADASDWLALPGKLHESELLDLYRRAWVVASASSHEGWGMTITEAGACGTPAVATKIPGHADAIEDGVTGRLVDGPSAMTDALHGVIVDEDLRRRMGDAARRRAAELTWDATARGTLEVLATEAISRRPRPT
jgi:glycosyltransferase involved in cell wall biosynthesis